MEAPTGDIDGCAGAHEHLRTIVAGLCDDAVHAPSGLPGWTVGHVLTHLARNAEAMCRRIEATTQGRLIDQYEHGASGRAAAIDAGATRPAHEITEDACLWSEHLDDVFRSLSNEVWARPVRTVAGGEHPVSHLPFRRWREVEVHLVDLDTGYSARDWSAAFVQRALPRLLAGLPGRADDRDLVAWLFGRGAAPELDAWG